TGKRLGPPLTQPAGVIWHVSFSADGRKVLTGGVNQLCTLWGLPTDQMIGARLMHQDRGSAVAFSPGGKMVGARTGVHRGRGAAQRWEAASGRRIGPPLPQTGHVTSVAFSHDGSKILTGTCNAPSRGEAQIWDAATGKPLGHPVTHPNDVVAVAF